MFALGHFWNDGNRIGLEIERAADLEGRFADALKRTVSISAQTRTDQHVADEEA